MIRQAYITIWRKNALWKENFQVEQDLVCNNTSNASPETIIETWNFYIKEEDNSDTKKEFLQNTEKKILDQDLLRDMEGLLRSGLMYDIQNVYKFVKTELLEKI